MHARPSDWRRCLPLFLLLFAAGCASRSPLERPPWDALSPPDQRARIVKEARSFLHARHFRVREKSFPYDCSGLVGAVLFKNGIDVFGGASELQIRGNGVRILHTFFGRYGELYRLGTPQPGDIVFFSNTYDRNRDRKLNDDFTHVGIVEEVDADGTVTFIHQTRGSVRRYLMNLRRPRQHQDGEGRIINSYLRRRQRSDAPGTPYLAGSLFAGFGTLARRAPEAAPGGTS